LKGVFFPRKKEMKVVWSAHEPMHGLLILCYVVMMSAGREEDKGISMTMYAS
jgi:hypothetical protein